MPNNHQSFNRDYMMYMENENGIYQYEQQNQPSYTSSPAMSNAQYVEHSNPYQTYRVDHHQNQQMQQRSHQPNSPQTNQFYLHDNTSPHLPTRRTWAQSVNNSNVESNPHVQQQQIIPLDVNAWSQNSPKIDTHTWKSVNQTNTKNPSFTLHQTNGDSKPSLSTNKIFQTSTNTSNMPASAATSHHFSNSENNDQTIISSPPIDDMAPQSISFIGDEDSVDLIAEHQRKFYCTYSKYLFISQYV